MMDDLDRLPDVEEAWQQFAQQHLPSVRPMHTWRKIAAVLIGILTLSGIAYATIHIVRQYHQPEVSQEADTVAEADSSPFTLHPSLPADTVVEVEPIVFDNVTLDSIASDIAAYHHLDMEMQNEQTHQLRFYFVWNPDDSLQEVIEKLNMFEQVNLTVENGKLIVR